MRGQDAYRILFAEWSNSTEVPAMPFTMHPLHLDAACADGDWGAVIVDHKGTPAGFWVYFVKKKGPFRYITMPPLTKWMGPWIHPAFRQTGAFYTIMEQLITGLPRVTSIDQNWAPAMTNALPALWLKMQVSVRYHQHINPLPELPETYAQSLDKEVVRRIQQTADQGYVLKSGHDPEVLLDIHKKGFAVKNLSWPVDDKTFVKILDAHQQLGWGQTLVCYTPQKHTPLAFIYTVHYQGTSYCVMQSATQEARRLRIPDYCVMESVTQAIKSPGITMYDFYGSSIRSIVQNRLRFTHQVYPYLRVTREPRLMRIFT